MSKKTKETEQTSPPNTTEDKKIAVEECQQICDKCDTVIDKIKTKKAKK